MCRINIHVLNCGVVIVDSELAFSTGESHNPLAFRSEERRVGKEC